MPKLKDQTEINNKCILLIDFKFMDRYIACKERKSLVAILNYLKRDGEQIENRKIRGS